MVYGAFSQFMAYPQLRVNHPTAYQAIERCMDHLAHYGPDHFLMVRHELELAHVALQGGTGTGIALGYVAEAAIRILRYQNENAPLERGNVA